MKKRGTQVILIVDTETTGLENAEVCEMAATLYSTEPRGAIASVSTLQPIAEKNNAEFINGISNKLAAKSQPIVLPMRKAICELAAFAKYATAFNSEFDRPFWEETIDLPWFCAMSDFEWGYHKERFTLVELALWLGIGVGTAHRAGDDVRLLVECFNRCSVFEMRLERAIHRSRSPLTELKAIISYNDRQLAKDSGFHWDSNRKIWVKKVRECDRIKSIEKLNFEIEIL